MFIDALWSPAGKGLTSFVMSNCVFVTFLCGILGQILGQVWYLIISIPDLCPFPTYIFENSCFSRT